MSSTSIYYIIQYLDLATSLKERKKKMALNFYRLIFKRKGNTYNHRIQKESYQFSHYRDSKYTFSYWMSVCYFEFYDYFKIRNFVFYIRLYRKQELILVFVFLIYVVYNEANVSCRIKIKKGVTLFVNLLIVRLW